VEETGRSGVSIFIARVAKRRGRWHAAFVVEVVIGAGANHASSANFTESKPQQTGTRLLTGHGEVATTSGSTKVSSEE